MGGAALANVSLSISPIIDISMLERKVGKRIANLSLAQSLEIKLSSNLLSGGEQSQL